MHCSHVNSDYFQQAAFLGGENNTGNVFPVYIKYAFSAKAVYYASEVVLIEVEIM